MQDKETNFSYSITSIYIDSVLAFSAVDHGFNHISVNPKTIKLSFVTSPQGKHGKKQEHTLVRVRIVLSSGATCRFSE